VRAVAARRAVGAVIPPGNVSYHLGVLARHGFVVDVPERARDKRERWWTAAHEVTSWEPAEALAQRAPLAGLLVSHAVSITGNMLTLIALPLYVLAETGSAAATGITGFFATLPIVLGGVFGGVLVDRFGYRRASVLADVASGRRSSWCRSWTARWA
jgi:hypothetical protein